VPSPPAGPGRSLFWEDPRATSVSVRLRSFTVRVSRGVAALGPVSSLGLGPAPSGDLAVNLGNEIRDTSELFLLPYTPSTSTRTLSLPGSSSPPASSFEIRRA
jgi:hypothetical protein